MSQTIYILVGLPGSGKSTWSKNKIKDDKKTVIICKDTLRTMCRGEYIFDKQLEPLMHEWADGLIQSALFNNYNIIIDETNLKKSHRYMLLQDIQHYYSSGMNKAKIICVWCKENKNNLQNRMNDDRGISQQQWSEIIENMKKIFEEPELSEGFDEILEITF